MRLLPAIVISLGAAAFGHAAEIAPGAVVSGDGRAVYLRVPRGALEARAVEQGSLLWRVADDLRPLAAQGGRVLCQRAAGEGRLDLVFLDAASGRPLGGDGVRAARGRLVAARRGRSARASTCARSRTGRACCSSGASSAGRCAARTSRRSTARTATRARATRTCARKARSRSTSPRRAPRPPRLRRRRCAALPPAVEAARGPGALRERPLRVGAFFVATRPGGRRAVAPALERARAARCHRSRSRPASCCSWARRTARHVLVSRELPGAPLAQAHEWSVIALDTGAVAATLRTSVAAAGFEVAGGRVLLALEAWGHRAPSGWRDEPRRLEAFGRDGRRRLDGSAARSRVSRPRGPVGGPMKKEKVRMSFARVWLRRPRRRAAARGPARRCGRPSPRTRSAARTRSRGPAPARTASSRASRTVR